MPSDLKFLLCHQHDHFASVFHASANEYHWGQMDTVMTYRKENLKPNGMEGEGTYLVDDLELWTH
jgi:hypothetical protein